MCGTVKRLLHSELKLIIHPGFIDIPTAERNYNELESLFENFHMKGLPEKGDA